MLLAVLRLIAAIVYLLVGTAIAIKGTLPIGSKQLVRQNAMPSFHHNVSRVSTQNNTSDGEGEIAQERNGDVRMTSNEEQAVSSNLSSRIAHGIATTQGNVIETWKVCS